MLKKIYRLNWKDVNFLYRKQNVIFWKFFWFFYFNQYPNRRYNQISFNISTKLSKHSVIRNNIKRIVYDYCRLNNFINLNLNSKFYKIFIIFNKKVIDNIQKTIETKDKKDIKSYIEEIFSNDLKNLTKKLWNHNW